MRFCTFLIFFNSFLTLNAQKIEADTAYKGVAAVVFLDSFVVTASRQGFDVEEFIRMVIEDKSFYQAFHNLRLVSYTAQNEMVFFDKKGRQKAQYSSRTEQQVVNRCRTMEVQDEVSSGNFYKKKKQYKYYTAKMFDRIFFTEGEKCEPDLPPEITDQGAKGMEKHIAELKKLMFQPGQEVNVPFIGGKTAIFSDRLSEYYNYSITSAAFDGKDCYLFTAEVKPEFTEHKVDKTVIKQMETYFEKSSFQVVGRNYHLFYQGAFFDFDVAMRILLTKTEDWYLPTKITYQGSWNIPAKKPEIGRFSMEVFDVVF